MSEKYHKNRAFKKLYIDSYVIQNINGCDNKMIIITK